MKGVPPSDWFTYERGGLPADGIRLESIAERHGTPSFVYAGRAIDEAYRQIDEALEFKDHLIAYAVKANGNLAVLRRLAEAGCGADIVSGGELARALKAGIPPERIVFSGVGKQRAEIEAALNAGIRSLHIESEAEVNTIEEVATALGKVANVSIRVNPDVDPQTHPYIATGLRQSKFGLSMSATRALLPRIAESEHLRFEGLAMHIGSQLGSPEPLREAVTLVSVFARECIDAGYPLQNLDVGGGWPMTYGHEDAPFPEPHVFGEAIRAGLEAGGILEEDFTLVTEPGRALVGDAGVLLSRVIYVKDQGEKRFVIVDAAMNDLIRPSLYQAYHAILPVAAAAEGCALREVDVVGPICESGDFLARDRELPPLAEGDLVAVRGAGAYAREMASTYNARPHAAEVMVDKGEERLIRERGSLESLWAGEVD